MPRVAGIIVGVLGIVAGMAIVVGVARYAFVTSDTLIDGVVWAAVFAIVALLALGGPVLAVLLGRQGWAWGIVAWLVAASAFAINCSNSLGAISGRGDKTQAERGKAVANVKADRARLARVEQERQAMTFTPAAADAVTAARDAVAAAERNRIAECGPNNEKRGARCRDREGDETTARTELAKVLANRGATEKAEALDREASALRARLDKAPAVQNANAHGAALAKVLQLSDADTASTIQQVALVTFVELAIAFMLAAAEKLLSVAPGRARNESPAAPAKEELPAAEPSNVVALIQPPKIGSVESFMLACVRKAKGASVSWAELYVRYRRWCAEQAPELSAMTAEHFGKKLDALRIEGVLRAKAKGDEVFCLGVKLVT